MDSTTNKPMLSFALPRAGHAQFACEVNRDGGQQQEPTEVSQLKYWTQQESPRFSKGRMSTLHRLLIIWLIPIVIMLTLLACGNTGPIRRVFAPGASIQQLTVGSDGLWQVQLRLRNYSTVAMEFEHLELALDLGEHSEITLDAMPKLVVSADSAEVFSVELKPESAARLLLADTLASKRALPYTLSGRIKATPQGGKSSRFELENRSQLNSVPGLPGVLR